MSKRPSLFAPMPERRAEPSEIVTGQLIETTGASVATKRPPSRAGKRVLSVYLDPLAWKQLRQLALDVDTSTQALG